MSGGILFYRKGDVSSLPAASRAVVAGRAFGVDDSAIGLRLAEAMKHASVYKVGGFLIKEGSVVGYVVAGDVVGAVALMKTCVPGLISSYAYLVTLEMVHAWYPPIAEPRP